MELTDEALLESFRKTGDSYSFTALMRRYQDRLYNMAFRVLDNTEEAEEVVQDTFLRVHERVDSFRSDTLFVGWIYRIAHNACRDLLRMRQRDGILLARDVPSGDDDGVRPGYAGNVPDKGPGPDEQVRLSEEAKLIEQSLKLLPDDQRIVVVLRDIEGLSYDEIGAVVGATTGTVRSRIHYGRSKLREFLKPYLTDASPATR